MNQIGINPDNKNTCGLCGNTGMVPWRPLFDAPEEQNQANMGMKLCTSCMYISVPKTDNGKP